MSNKKKIERELEKENIIKEIKRTKAPYGAGSRNCTRCARYFPVGY